MHAMIDGAGRSGWARNWTSMPTVGPRYWGALCLASILGANVGDVVSRFLHLGYWHGLPPLAVLFAVTMLAARFVPSTEACYWIGIVIVRTAATNLADLQTLAVGVPMPLVGAGFLALLAVLVAASRRSFGSAGLPATDGFFWGAMLAAGTLGTACGDDLAFVQGLGPPTASALMTVALVVALAWRATSPRSPIMTFWSLVIVIRTWGTNVGDMTADRWGLAASTLAALVLFAGLLFAWRPARLAGSGVAG